MISQFFWGVGDEGEEEDIQEQGMSRWGIEEESDYRLEGHKK